MEYIFWLLALAAAYPYVIYPALVWTLARLFGRHGRSPTPADDQWPRVSLLIVAHNEQALIRQRIENALAAEYPGDRLQIVIASDGSTDATVRIVGDYADRGVVCIPFSERRGKAAALRSAAEHLSGDVIVLSDANSFFRPGAIKAMSRWFLESNVGVVCGRLVLADKKNTKNCDGLYWRFETWLKQSESQLGALLGSNGAIYSIRRELLPHLPVNAIVDDFELPLVAKLQTGCDLLFEADAIADEETPPKIASEFNRRSRIGMGAFKSLERLHPLLNPVKGWIAFTFVSHKVFRWIGPFFLIGLAVVNAFLIDRPFFETTLWFQLAFYTLAVVGLLMPAQAWPRVARLPTLFVTVNAALLVGFFKWVMGRESAVWQPTPRTETLVGQA